MSDSGIERKSTISFLNQKIFFYGKLKSILAFIYVMMFIAADNHHYFIACTAMGFFTHFFIHDYLYNYTRQEVEHTKCNYVESKSCQNIRATILPFRTKIALFISGTLVYTILLFVRLINI